MIKIKTDLKGLVYLIADSSSDRFLLTHDGKTFALAIAGTDLIIFYTEETPKGSFLRFDPSIIF